MHTRDVVIVACVKRLANMEAQPASFCREGEHILKFTVIERTRTECLRERIVHLHGGSRYVTLHIPWTTGAVHLECIYLVCFLSQT